MEELVDTLPAFRDTVLYDGRTLTLHRKAQNLAADLAIVYGSRDERFRFEDVDRLAADSGKAPGDGWRRMGEDGGGWRRMEDGPQKGRT